MRKSILSLAIIFVFSSLAIADDHFSFAGFDLSLTPQQAIDKALSVINPQNSMNTVATTIEPEKKSRMIDYKRSNVYIKSPVFSNQYENSYSLQKIFSLSKDDVIISWRNYDKIFKVNKDYAVDQIDFASINEYYIRIIYITIPGFKKSPLMLIANGNSIPYVPDVFNKKYGKSENVTNNISVNRGNDVRVRGQVIFGGGVSHGMQDTNNNNTIIYWKNDKEIACFDGFDPAGANLSIINIETYKAMVQFVATEVRRLDAEQKAKQKAVEDSIKSKM